MSWEQWAFLAVLAAILVGSVVGALACRGLRILDSWALEGRVDEAERPVPW